MKVQNKIRLKAALRVARDVAIMIPVFLVCMWINWLLKEFVGTWATWILPVAGTGFILWSWYHEAKDSIECNEAIRNFDDEDSEDQQ